jgi:hypothetical protein
MKIYKAKSKEVIVGACAKVAVLSVNASFL